jgi:hypothetical protein
LNLKQGIGILFIVVGIALLIFVFYGKGQIEEGRDQIASGKQKVKQTQQMFSFTPVTKQVGQGLTSGAQDKIATGELTIEQYEAIFMWCEIGGIALLVVGAGLVLFCGRKKRK